MSNDFNGLGLSAKVTAAVADAGYTKPTDIQAQAIPHVLQKKDIIGIAQTGTGKTASFVLPMLTLLESGRARARMPRTLILEPTRELAAQVAENFEKYGKNHKLTMALLIGGVSFDEQNKILDRGADVLIATPGRMLDQFERGRILLSGVDILVIDEADRMLDMGFVHDVKRIIARLPEKRQTLFFSATMPMEIHRLAESILTSPVYVEVTPISSTADTINQSVYMTEKTHKPSLLKHILSDNGIETALVFTRTKHGADKVSRILNKSGISAEAIHGNKSQGARQTALNNFRSRRTRVLVATDIAARGIDIDNLTHVINFDLPDVPETYVHRIGRTGRAGASGTAISFCDITEKMNLLDIQKLIGKQVPVITEHPFPMEAWAQYDVRTQPQAPTGGRPQLRNSRRGGGGRRGIGLAPARAR